jgi:DNA invertase Pin-like site-specific DNA recombinase
MPKRVAAYVRVSTTEQTTENQRPAIEALCRDRGYTVVRWFEETISGAAKRRPVFEEMLAGARSRKFDALVVWSVDRFSRGGAGSCFAALGQIDAAGVDFVSVKESYLDTSGPFRDVLLAFAATVARMERERLVERTKAGLERARRDGKRLGRPPASPVMLTAARDLVAAGIPVAEAARRKGVARSTLRRFIRAEAGTSGN